MNRTIALLLLTVLAGCAVQTESGADEAIADFIAVSELEELRTVRMRQQFSYDDITERFIVVKSKTDRYLVEFRRRCRELNQNDITPDIRRDRNALRAGIDTIRGCIIDRMFAIDEAQAQELEQLGRAPG
jgi:hypothetical protein